MQPGDVVVFEPKNLHPIYWHNLPEAERIKCYGSLGYGQETLKRFVFLCEIRDAHGPTGHCVLVSMDDQHIESMRHISDFRLVTEQEF